MRRKQLRFYSPEDAGGSSSEPKPADAPGAALADAAKGVEGAADATLQAAEATAQAAASAVNDAVKTLLGNFTEALNGTVGKLEKIAESITSHAAGQGSGGTGSSSDVSAAASGSAATPPTPPVEPPPTNPDPPTVPPKTHVGIAKHMHRRSK